MPIVLPLHQQGSFCNGILTALNPDNLGGLNDFPLMETLSTLTGSPCWLLNDAQAATWAEYYHRRDTISDMAFITVSTGVGGGIVQQGRAATNRKTWSCRPFRSYLS